MIRRLAATAAAAVALIATGTAAASTASADTAPASSVPTHLRVIGTSGGEPILAWDAPASGPVTRYKLHFDNGVGHYSSTTTSAVGGYFYQLCISHGTHSVWVGVGNALVGSAPLQVTL